MDLNIPDTGYNGQKNLIKQTLTITELIRYIKGNHPII